MSLNTASLPNLKLVPHAVMCQFYLGKRQQAKKTV
ncbi:Cold shock-like protein cspC (fragment) [Klebsiella pneumoniae]